MKLGPEFYICLTEPCEVQSEGTTKLIATYYGISR